MSSTITIHLDGLTVTSVEQIRNGETTFRSVAQAQEQQRGVTEADILRAIRSDPRYTKRTLWGIQEALPEFSAGSVNILVARMVVDDQLTSEFSHRTNKHYYSIPAAQAQEQPELTAEAVWRAIRSDPRYHERTTGAIKSMLAGFDGAFVEYTLEKMYDNRQLDRRYSQSQGDYLYRVSANVEPAAQSAQTTRAATQGDILSAIQSDPRFGARTLKAIQECITACDPDDVATRVEIMVANGALNKRHSARLGANLYSVL